MSVTYQSLAPHQFQQYLLWRSNGDAYTLEILEKQLQHVVSGGQQVYVALEQEQLVGTVQLVYKRPDLQPIFADGVENAYIQALEINPQYRRKGIGTQLMEHLEAVARKTNFKRLTLMVELDNEPAIRFYQVLGYSEFNRSFWTWKGVDYPTSCLEKQL